MTEDKENQKFMVHGGGIKLPIGYRFRPTDEELVVHYLKRKVHGLPLPASVIPELDVFQTDPWSLPGDVKEKRYFFSMVKGNEKGSKRRRVLGFGHWKVTSKSRQIEASSSNQVVGIRKTLVFCQGKHSTISNTTSTTWFMHEFHLLGTNQQLELGNWVVYKVFQKKNRSKRQEANSKASNPHKTQALDVVVGPSIMDFTVELENSDNAGPPQPSSPYSSGITEVSSIGLDQEEVSSLFSCFSDSSFRNN